MNVIRRYRLVIPMSEKLSGLAPIIEPDFKVLILGTMPSTISLQRGEYYANPMNQFWRIICSVLGSTTDPQQCCSYADKIILLRNNGIGLWDVLKECERKGSGDPDIKNGVSNNFVELLSEYSNVQCICFNGQKANQLFFKLNKKESFRKVKFYILPSSSSANARTSFNEKVEKWQIVGK